MAGFAGPNYGVAGIRALLGVQGRPLLATALKPMGSTEVELAGMAAAFARGGGDIVKDDQNIVDASFAAFRSRVSRIADAVSQTNCLYFPHLSGPQEELETRLRFILGLGLKGVLICPAIVGLDTMRSLAAKRKAIFMAHPAYSGAFYAERSHGIEHSLYLGTLMRLAGADITVFPNAGGRFAFTPDECRATAERGRAPLGRLSPIFPAPGGGMNLDNTGAMAKDFGVDSIWLVGGRLLMHPGGPEAGARAFREKMA
jgi:ribulose-bisphosphate carboxylase large chain